MNISQPDQAAIDDPLNGPLPEFVSCINESSQPPQVDWWHVEETGNADADFERGAQYGKSAVDTGRKIKRPDFVENILCGIILKGRFGPVEIGFLYGVARSAYLHGFN